jgi:catechol 2,3-dioxygenase-like lactoylglutathione lyase family enzyme
MITGVKEMGHFGIHVQDVERSLAFYRDLLGMEQVAYFEESDQTVRDVTGYPDGELKTAHLRVPNSDMFMEIIKYEQPKGTPVDPQPANPGTVHLAFFVDDLQATFDRLIAAGVEPAGRVTDIPLSLMEERIAGETQWPGNLQRLIGGKAVYIRDPDGIRVELDQSS